MLQNSSALRTAVGFGLGGVGYALGNLLLARALPPAQFGVFTLFLALVQIGVTLGPIGLEGQVNRRPGGAVSPRRPLLTSTVVAAATAFVAATVYRMDPGVIIALVISIVTGGFSRVIAAVFQSRLRFGLALSFSQGLALALLAMGALAVIAGEVQLRLLAALVAAYYVITAAMGWRLLSREQLPDQREVPSFREGLSLLGITAAAMILMQLERLLTPRLLTLEDLATFAVITTLVGSPLRMLQMGAGYTLLPRLSTASTPEMRRQLVRREALAVALIAGIGTGVILLAAPVIADLLLAGKYQLSTALIMAALVSGMVKLADGFVTTMVWALGSARQLATLNWVSWTCAGVGVVGAWAGARWGLVGLMYGTTLGWICRGAVAGALAAKQMRENRTTRPHAGAQEVASPQ